MFDRHISKHISALSDEFKVSKQRVPRLLNVQTCSPTNDLSGTQITQSSTLDMALINNHRTSIIDAILLHTVFKYV